MTATLDSRLVYIVELLLISSWVKDSNEGVVLTTRTEVDTAPYLEGGSDLDR